MNRIHQHQSLFRDADWEFGVNVKFATISMPNGPAGVFRIPQVKRFIGKYPVCLTLDGIYHGGNFDEAVLKCAQITKGASVLAAETNDPRPYGWIKMSNDNRRVLDIIEKPNIIPEPNRRYLVQTHMYFYGPEVVQLANQLELSIRKEYEVTDLHKLFLSQRKLRIFRLHDSSKGLIWDDCGTAAKLLALANTIQSLQEKVLKTLAGSPHLQALKNGWVTPDQIREVCTPFLKKRIEYYDALLDAVERFQRSFRK